MCVVCIITFYRKVKFLNAFQWIVRGGNLTFIDRKLISCMTLDFYRHLSEEKTLFTFPLETLQIQGWIPIAACQQFSFFKQIYIR